MTGLVIFDNDGVLVDSERLANTILAELLTEAGLPYTFEVEPTKPFLLVSAEPAIWEWTITDTTAPDTTIVSGPPAGVLPDAPVLFVERLMYGTDMEPLEIVQTWYRGDAYEYTVRLDIEPEQPLARLA